MFLIGKMIPLMVIVLVLKSMTIPDFPLSCTQWWGQTLACPSFGHIQKCLVLLGTPCYCCIWRILLGACLFLLCGRPHLTSSRGSVWVSPFDEKGDHHPSHNQVELGWVFLWWPSCYFCDGGHGHTWPLHYCQYLPRFVYFWRRWVLDLIIIGIFATFYLTSYGSFNLTGGSNTYF